MSACILLYHTFCVPFRYLVSTLDRLSCVVLGFQMSYFLSPNIGFADSTSCSTQNLASVAWAIYAPTSELISLQGVCLSRATNNVAEYSIGIGLLIDAISIGICHLVIRLDSQLVVLQLSNVYDIQSPTFLQVYL
jgi:hypothetical protein